MTRPMKLRFAPSPTGYLHVGGARTAIFNLLHGRRHGGTMLLRIEDTDVERSRQHHAEQIVSALNWLGVEYDEGPIYQSDRLDRYRQRVDELLEKGSAYLCFCSVEVLDDERQAAEKAGKQYKYSGRCRRAADRGDEDREGPHVVRCRVEPGRIEFRDLIRGDVHFEGENLDDFVLLRSDRNPTYHLSVVVDDIDMDVTHVARGDDHLSNTPKHILLFRAFGAEVPVFAHLPLILGSDRKRLSKRTGATSVEEYRSLGILPDALFNFLSLLGWSPGGDREIITRSESEKIFDLSDVNKAAAVFDDEKLSWLNGQYLSRMPARDIYPHLLSFLTMPIDDDDRLFMIIDLFKSRSRTLRDLAQSLIPYYIEDEALEYDAAAVSKHLKGEDVARRLRDVRDALAAVEPFTIEGGDKAVRELAEKSGLGAGKYIHPLRVALVGQLSSPPIFDVAVALGKERSLRRVDRLLGNLPALSS
ncbi:MAG TPA: glutamate--tRNA ligase [Thermoanaerobaculia bacterium]|nr:glutamate--tRNA ligase [Thermoanaerobaculia bacterium]